MKQGKKDLLDSFLDKPGEGKAFDLEAPGDTTKIDAFSRLVDFIKREHIRQSKPPDPTSISKMKKVERYRSQIPAQPVSEIKKGLQLKKAV